MQASGGGLLVASGSVEAALGLVEQAGHPEMDRSIKAMPNEGKPAIVMVVGVNGTGKTTTTGKLARVLVAMETADVIVMVVDTKVGITETDEVMARRLHKIPPYPRTDYRNRTYSIPKSPAQAISAGGGP